MFGFNRSLHQVIFKPHMKFWEQTPNTFIFSGLKNVKCKMNFSPNSLMEMEMEKKYSSVFEKTHNVQTLLHTNFICHRISL